LNGRAHGDQVVMLRRAVTALLTVAAVVLFDAAAAHAEVFRGDTSQGRRASVVVGTDGLLRAARVNWRARCRDGRVFEKTIFRRPHDESTPDAFFDSGTYRRRSDDGYRLRFTTTIRGRRLGSGANERWRGTFRAKVLVTRRGNYVDTCRLRGLRWTARLVD
jgi:hypothetical protein